MEATILMPLQWLSPVSADLRVGVNGVLFSTRLHLVTPGYVFQDLSSLLLTHAASLFKQDSVAKE